MKNARKRLEDFMNAVTFAEANEHETALGFVRETGKKKVSWEDMMTAITFAEAGLVDTAREFLQVRGPKTQAARLALPGIKIWTGLIPVQEHPLAGVKIWTGVVPVNA